MSDPCLKIQPPASGLYQGAFVDDTVSESAINSFAKTSGTQVDIVLKFLAFATGLYFPTNEAQTVSKKGGAIFIKLEPWSWKKNVDTFPLQKIVDGKYDHLLKRFADGAKKFGKPVFVSFGHEMNGNSYPWAGNADLYKKAFRHVHDVIQKAGAKNITWVWNPDIVSAVRDYYPGDAYVDWVAIDGYNWEGTATASSLFSKSIKTLKTFGKPIMIGEFGCGKNNTACLTDFVDYATKETAIKAFIYFNQDKERKWALKTTAEKAAYLNAVKAKEKLFKSTISSTSAVCPVPSLAPAKVAAPTETFKTLPANKLFETNLDEMPSSARITKLRNQRKAEWRKFKKKRQNKLIKRERELSELLISKWLLSREMGSQSMSSLNEALSYSRKSFWNGLLAMIFLEDPELAPKYLPKLSSKDAFKVGKKISKENKLKFLELIHDEFIGSKGDTRLRAENLTKRAILAWELEKKSDFAALTKEARQIISFYQDPANKKVIIKQIKSRMPGGSSSQIAKEYKYGLGKVRVLEAKLLLVTAEENLEKLEQAHKLAAEASHYLEGLENLETRLLAVESLVRQGFIHANAGKDPKPLFDKAREHVKYILDWEKAYLNHADFEGTPPRWLKQIKGLALTWKAKTEMFEAGGITKENTKKKIEAEKKALEESEKTLKEILGLKDYLDAPTLADIKRTLGENLARRGFILMEQGNTGYTNLFKQARKYLKAAAKDGRNDTRAEANLWLAKILTVEAGKMADKKETLKKAEEYLAKALVKSGDEYILKNSTLSSALQTYGDILAGRKDFIGARKKYEEAIKEYPRNFDALGSLADTYNWTKDYETAAQKYKEVKNNTLPNSSLHLKAQLGELEATLRQNNSYGAIKKNTETFKLIFEGEPKGSSLITRAVRFMVEAYMAEKNTHKQIILIANALLGKGHQTEAKAAPTVALLTANIKNNNLDPKLLEAEFKAELHLSLAQVLAWEKPGRFAEADEVLKAGRNSYAAIIKGNTALDIRYELIEAVVKMRKNKADGKETVEIYKAVKRIFAESSDDLALVEEGLKVLLEEFLIEKRLDRIVLLADYLLDKKLYAPGKSEKELIGIFEKKHIPALGATLAQIKATLNNLSPAQIELLFKGQEKAYQEFKFNLLLKLVNALSWSKKHLEAFKLAKTVPEDPHFKASSPMEKASVYIVLGELYRYGEGIKQLAESRKSYQEVIKLLQGFPEEQQSSKYFSLLAKAYYGLAKIAQEEGKRKETEIYLKKAYHYAGKSADKKELRDAVFRTKAFLPDHYLNLDFEVFADKLSRIENRLKLLGELPLWNGIFVPTLAYQLDMAEGLNAHSLFLGAKFRLLDIWNTGSHSLNLETKFNLCQSKKCLDYSQPNAEIKFFPWRDNITSIFYSNKHFSAGFAGEFNFREPDYNSYYAAAMGTISDFSFGAEYNRYLFTYTGEKKVRHDLNLAFRYILDLAKLGLDNFDQAKLNFSLGYPYMQFDQASEEWLYSPASIKLGLGVDIHLGKGLLLDLDASFVHQSSLRHGGSYSYGLFSAGIRW